jgi:hypothetical protein
MQRSDFRVPYYDPMSIALICVWLVVNYAVMVGFMVGALGGWEGWVILLLTLRMVYISAKYLIRTYK